MHRSSKRVALLSIAILIAFFGATLAPAQPSQAAPRHAASIPQSGQVIYLDVYGQVFAQSWSKNVQTNVGTLSTVWQSGAGDAGWTNLVTGDFNGDGKADIIAASGQRLKVFFPILNTSQQFNSLVSAYTIQLLAAGNFQQLGRDQVAYTFSFSDGNGTHEALYVDTLDPITGNLVASRAVNIFDGRLQAIAAGDVNRDGYSDITVLQKTNKNGGNNRQVYIYSGKDLSSLLYMPPEDAYCCLWNAVAVGNMDKDNGDTDHPGNELAMSRQAGPPAHSVILGWWHDLGDPEDVNTIDTWEPDDYAFYPWFSALALGDVDGDPNGDMEVVGLRDPGSQDKAYLVLLNPGGPPMRTFEDYGPYYGSLRWYGVAAGDINNDGRAEVVTIRSTGLRVFDQPAINNENYDFPGNVWPTVVAIADLGFNYNITLTPSTLTFTGGQTESLPWQYVKVETTSATPVNWTVASSDPANLWLDRASGTTPGYVGINVNTNRDPGSYTGTVTVNAGGVKQNVTVNVTINKPTLAVDPASLTFNFDSTQYYDSSTQTLAISNGSGGTSFTWVATVTGGGSWLSVSQSSGPTPTDLKVMVSAQAAGVGTKSATIKIDSPWGSSQIPVTVNVTDPGFMALPSKLNFVQIQGSSDLAKPRTLALVRPPVNGVPETVTWHVAAITLSAASKINALSAADNLEWNSEGLIINGSPVPGVDWLQLSKLTGTTPGASIASLDPSVSSLPTGRLRALLVFVTEPFHQEWVRTVETNLLVIPPDGQRWLPFSPK